MHRVGNVWWCGQIPNIILPFSLVYKLTQISVLNVQSIRPSRTLKYFTRLIDFDPKQARRSTYLTMGFFSRWNGLFRWFKGMFTPDVCVCVCVWRHEWNLSNKWWCWHLALCVRQTETMGWNPFCASTFASKRSCNGYQVDSAVLLWCFIIFWMQMSSAFL